MLYVMTVAPSCGVFQLLQGASDTRKETIKVSMGSKVSSKMAAPTARVIQVTSLLEKILTVDMYVLYLNEHY